MKSKKIPIRCLQAMIILIITNGWSFAQTTNSFPLSGNVGIGTTSPEVTNNYTILDIIGKTPTNGGYISLSTSDKTGQGRVFVTNQRLVSDVRKPGMYFQWRNSSSTQIHRLNSDGTAIWNGFASSYTAISSNSNGQYINQYGIDGSSQSWIIRGYEREGVQAEFKNGGVNVNGVLKAKEVNVTSSGWADYVFEEGYRLMPLSEVKAFIEENNRLPNIQPEAEVRENGVNLAEINVKLLEKIEELTLYAIEQDEMLKKVLTRLSEVESKLAREN